jgi:hypothetical protein
MFSSSAVLFDGRLGSVSHGSRVGVPLIIRLIACDYTHCGCSVSSDKHISDQRDWNGTAAISAGS